MNKSKFRAWDKVNKIMVTDFNGRKRIETPDGFYMHSLDVINGNEIHAKLKIANRQEMIFRPFKEMPLMQYTGLKDNDGVEIYEGDRIKGKYPNGTHFKGVVTYDTDRAAYIVKTTDSWCPSSLESCKNCVVLDNIHANPELLNDAQ